MAHRDHHEPLHPIRHAARELPGQRRSPVVTDHGGTINSRVLQDSDDVTQQNAHPTVRNGHRSTRPAEAPQVGGDHPVPGTGEHFDLMPPQPPRVREPVQQQHRPTRPGRCDIQPHTAVLDEPLDHPSPPARVGANPPTRLIPDHVTDVVLPYAIHCSTPAVRPTTRGA
jgi:hypothetical protein